MLLNLLPAEKLTKWKHKYYSCKTPRWWGLAVRLSKEWGDCFTARLRHWQ